MAAQEIIYAGDAVVYAGDRIIYSGEDTGLAVASCVQLQVSTSPLLDLSVSSAYHGQTASQPVLILQPDATYHDQVAASAEVTPLYIQAASCYHLQAANSPTWAQVMPGIVVSRIRVRSN